MQLSYDTGLLASAVIGAASAVLLLLRLTSTSAEDLNSLERMVLVCVLGLSCVAIAYPSLNLFLQGDVTITDTLKAELRSSVLGLRIASVLLGINGLKYVVKTLQALTPGLKPPSSYELPSYFELLEVRKLGKLLDQKDINRLIVAQYGLYMTIAATLWAFTVLQIQSTVVAVVNWGFFFVIDDWVIISDFLHLLGGHTLKSHRRRILLFNLGLVSLSLVAMFTSFSWLVASLVGSGMLLLLLYRYGHLMKLWLSELGG